MLAGITSFLFGETLNTNETSTIDTSNTNAQIINEEFDKENRAIEFEELNGTGTEEDGEWVIIEYGKKRAEKCRAKKCEKVNERTNDVPNLCNIKYVPAKLASTTIYNNNNNKTAIHRDHDSPNITNNRANDVAAAVAGTSNIGTMEGSWFVTPPPCFTHPNTFAMESSPLEDILIEHPSVSVFYPRPSPKGHFHYHQHEKIMQQQQQQSDYERNGGVDGKKLLSNRARKQAIANERLENQKQKSAANSDLSIKAGLLAEITNMAATAQKSVEFAPQKYLKKTFMDRQNKVACRQNGRPSRQKKLSTTINGYSVNRKMY